MDLNNPIVTPNARHVSGRCMLAGKAVEFVSYSVTSNGFRGASTFDLTLAISALPPEYGMDWFSKQTTIPIELYSDLITASGTDSKRLIKGNVDELDYDPARFTINLTGRDFTALFIDAKSAGETFKNYTSSQIIQMLAEKQGLKAEVTPTTQRFGEFYQIDSAHLTGEQTQWDLMTTLAGLENYAVWIDGDTVYFHPEASATTSEQYVIRWQPPGLLAYPQANVSDDLRFSRALTISKGVTVEVLSWNSKRKNKQFIASYPKRAKSATPGSSTPKTQVYRIIRNGLSPEQANALAEKIYRDVVLHEMKMSCSTAGDNLLTPRTLIRIEGTKSMFDQNYWCDAVTRTLDWEGGYVMTISAKNHSPALEVTTS
ncbi:type IV secretion protein Rhs [Klebsiella variicola]|uniref:type IV secretion protein Rhs n=1 Tax=Klebsiella variicola TaxID=244366 RepID=UPI0011ED4E9B|nr:type IV secretion protein Rhs [Klebsiella variicola]KAA0473419.1 type IV secretion protein Rhs [Klebsiella variicola]